MGQTESKEIVVSDTRTRATWRIVAG